MIPRDKHGAWGQAMAKAREVSRARQSGWPKVPRDADDAEDGHVWACLEHGGFKSRTLVSRGPRIGRPAFA